VKSVTKSPLAPRWKAESGSVTFSVDPSDGPVVVSVSDSSEGEDGEGVGPGPGATVVGSPDGVVVGPSVGEPGSSALEGGASGLGAGAGGVGLYVLIHSAQQVSCAVGLLALLLPKQSVAAVFFWQHSVNFPTSSAASLLAQLKSSSSVHIIVHSSALVWAAARQESFGASFDPSFVSTVLQTVLSVAQFANAVTLPAFGSTMQLT